jgi:hypothetical protein
LIKTSTQPRARHKDAAGTSHQFASPQWRWSIALSVTRQNLEEKFRLYNDEELRRLYHSDDLTALAKEVAAAELQRRGLDLATPEVAVAAEEPTKTLIGQAYERPRPSRRPMVDQPVVGLFRTLNCERGPRTSHLHIHLCR